MPKPSDWRERPIVFRRGAFVLEALYHRGSGPAAVVAPPHPLLGGSMDHPVVAEVAFALGRSGASTLRFNFQGVGASQGRASADWKEALGDFRAGAEEIRSTAEVSGYVAAGYSFGAAVAFLAALEDPRVERLVLVSPPIQVPGAREAFPDLKGIQSLRIPVHLFAGQQDPWCPSEALLALLEPIGPRVHLQWIPGADHVFTQGLSELGRAAARVLPEPPSNESPSIGI